MLVVYVSPFLRKDVPIFLNRLSQIDEVRVGLISTFDEEELPPGVLPSLAAYWRVNDLMDVEELIWAAQELSQRLGPIGRMITEYEMVQLPVAEARARLGVAGMSPDTILGFRDKAIMKDRLTAAGVPCARHRGVFSPEEAWDFATEVGFPIIVKPVDGVGARETRQCESVRDFEEALAADPPCDLNPIQLEEFIQGEEHTLDTLSIDGQAVWHSITRYLPNPLEVLRNPWMQWRILTPREIDVSHYDDIRSVGEQALKALGMESGLSHMEWFRRPDGSVAISEVGARPPGSRVFTPLNWANDFDMYDAWVRLMVTGRCEPPQERKYAVGTAFFRGIGTGHVVAIHGLEGVLREFDSMIVESELPYLGQVKADIFDGQGYLMLRHPETRVVEQAILEIVSRVQVEIG